MHNGDITLHEVGPVYGVRNFLNTLSNSEEISPFTLEWQKAAASATRRPLTSATMTALLDDVEARARKSPLLHVERCYDRRLGERTEHLTIYTIEAVTVETSINTNMPFHEDGVSIERYRFDVARKRIDVEAVFTGLIISKHALERLYERRQASLTTFANIVCEAALKALDAYALGLVRKIHQSVNLDGYKHRNMAIPFAEGLLILDNSVRIDQDHLTTQLNVTIKHGKALLRERRAMPEERSFLDHTSSGRKVVVRHYHHARTFIAASNISPKKQKYFEVFEQLVNTYELDTMREVAFTPRSVDQKPLQLLVDPELNKQADLLIAMLADGGVTIQPTAWRQCRVGDYKGAWTKTLPARWAKSQENRAAQATAKTNPA